MVVPGTLLSQAGKEVQLADHVLAVTYPVARQQALLLSAMRHACSAIDLSMKALDGAKVASYDAAKAVFSRFRSVLDHYREAPTAFSRGNGLVIASEGFADLKRVDFELVEQDMRTVKEFVYQAGRHVMAR